MLNPSIGKLLKSYKSRYQLVIDVARKARTIAREAEEEKSIPEEKPVNLAIEELAATASMDSNTGVS